MKARVKATGDIIEISEDCSYLYAEHYDKSYNLNQLEFLDVWEKIFPKHQDYWTHLEHQAAIAAMQGLCANTKFMRDHEGDFQCNEDMIAAYAKDIAHALVEKMKEERK